MERGEGTGKEWMDPVGIFKCS